MGQELAFPPPQSRHFKRRIPHEIPDSLFFRGNMYFKARLSYLKSEVLPLFVETLM